MLPPWVRIPAPPLPVGDALAKLLLVLLCFLVCKMGTGRGLDLKSGVQMSQCVVRILELRLAGGEPSMTIGSLLLL